MDTNTISDSNSNRSVNTDRVVLGSLDADYCVLLYYHYVHIADPTAVVNAQLSLCQHLQLYGRVRVSPEGLNGTLGGSSASVRAYTEAVEADEILQAKGRIHWKLSGCVDQLSLDRQKLTNLSVKETKEVVSLDLDEDTRLLMLQGKLPEDLYSQYS